MAPRRRRARKGRRSGGTRIDPYINSAAKLAALAFTVRKLKRMINVEYHSLTTDWPAPAQAGSVTNLSAMAQGDTNSTRTGLKIRPFSLACKGLIAINASATRSQVRAVIVQDRAGTTTPPVLGDLFNSAADMFNGQHHTSSPQVNSRFNVLYDRLFTLQDNGTQSKRVSFYKTLNGHIYYSGTAATDEGRNAIYLLVATNEATNVPAVTVDAIFKYIDN